MSLAKDFITYLEGAVTARIYAVVFPSDVVYPACRVQRIGGAPLTTHDGDSGDRRARFQVSCFAATYSEAKALEALVETACSAFNGAIGESTDASMLVVNESDLYEPGPPPLHHVAIDVEIIAHTT